MKLPLDQGLPRTAASLLRVAGIDTVHVGEIGMATAEDAEILSRSQQEGRIIVTLDADFHALLASSGATSPSVIRIRVECLRGEAAEKLVQTVLPHCADELDQGAVVSAQPDRLHIRRLPLS